MKKKQNPILTLSLLAVSALAANAATLFTVIDSSGSPAGNRSLANFTIGQQFTVGASDILVTSLGYEDAGADGLTDSHFVGIWGTTGLVASVTVPAGTGTTKIEAWRYETLASAVTLTAGSTYRIGGVTSAADRFTDIGQAANKDADFAISGDASSDAGTLTTSNRFRSGQNDPTTDGGDLPLRWVAGNLEYTVVPEPGTAALAGLAGICLLIRRRR